VVILGLVLVFMGLPFDHFLFFAGGSLLIQAFNFFRMQRWISQTTGFW